MYLVGILQSRWVLITDGHEVFASDRDVDIRACGEPSAHGRRIYRLTMTQDELQRQCAANGIELRGRATHLQQLKMVSAPIVAGAVGAFVAGGPIGAAVGGALGWLFRSPNAYSNENLASWFAFAKRGCENWASFDVKELERAAAELERAAAYQKAIEHKWCRYHQLRSIKFLYESRGIPFEAAVAALYEADGYAVEKTKASGDYGVDILARRSAEVLAVQAKGYSKRVGVRAVQEAISGALFYKATKAVVATNSFFTTQAKQLANASGVTLVDKVELTDMWRKHNTSAPVPAFSMREYKALEKDIDRLLFWIDFKEQRGTRGW